MIDPDLWFPSREQSLRMQHLIEQDKSASFLDSRVFVHWDKAPSSDDEDPAWTPSTVARRMVRDFATPGEIVVPRRNAKLYGAEIPPTLTEFETSFEVTELHLFHADDGTVQGFYRLKDKLGYFNMMRFSDIKSAPHYYGVLGARDGVFVFLPFEDFSKPRDPHADIDKMLPCGPAFRLDAPLDRRMYDEFAIPHPLLDSIHKPDREACSVERAIAYYEAPSTGEMTLYRDDDGRYGLICISWCTDSSPREEGLFNEACERLFAEQPAPVEPLAASEANAVSASGIVATATAADAVAAAVAAPAGYSMWRSQTVPPPRRRPA